MTFHGTGPYLATLCHGQGGSERGQPGWPRSLVGALFLPKKRTGPFFWYHFGSYAYGRGSAGRLSP
jgi:hypothetical protein